MRHTYRYKVSHNGEYLFHVWDVSPQAAREAAKAHLQDTSFELTIELDQANYG